MTWPTDPARETAIVLQLDAMHERLVSRLQTMLDPASKLSPQERRELAHALLQNLSTAPAGASTGIAFEIAELLVVASRVPAALRLDD